MLHAEVWGAPLGMGAPVVLVVHGITANSHALKRLADALGDSATVLAPDLRGRGLSADLEGPFGIARHAADVVSLLDRFEVDSAVVLGHSMGGFVAAMTAVTYPNRVERVVLVDGGLPLPVPPGSDPQRLLDQTLGPTIERLDLEFETFDDYLAYWKRHPAMQEIDDDYLRIYLEHDVGSAGPPVRSIISRAAVRQDGGELMTDIDVRRASSLVKQPLLLVRASRGILNQQVPRVPAAQADAFAAGRPNVKVREARDTNHFSVISQGAAVEMIAGEVLSGFVRR